jgi:cytochrome b6-f complex iron-sulfur subunit
MRISRRTFVGGTAVAASGLVTVGCGNAVQPAPLAAEVAIVATPGDRHFGMITVAANGYAELVPVGGAITVPIAVPRAPALPFIPPSAILLVHRAASDPGQFVAFDSLCPHAGCPLGYTPDDQLIKCPCHGSRFVSVADAASGRCPGDVVHLPARAAVRSYPVTVDGDQLLIDLRPPDASGPTIEVKIADHPELVSVGGATVINPHAGACGAGGPLILIRKDAATVVALDASCTHAGCTLDFNRANGDLECPCHGSTFDLAGGVTHAPAARPLASYAVRFDGETIVIDRSR